MSLLAAVISLHLVLAPFTFCSQYGFGAISETVWDRGLVDKKVVFSGVLKGEQEHGEYYEDVNQRNFAGRVLAFVTPWNKRGYQVASTFAAKLSHVSPVWYQIGLNKDHQVELRGGHDVDDTWIEALVKGHQEVAPDAMAPVMMGIKELLGLLVKEAQAHGYDGWVLEAWPQWVATGLISNSYFHSAALKFMGVLANNLHSMSSSRIRAPLELHVVVPPLKPAHTGLPATAPDDWHSLTQLADGLIVMTYDASFAGNPGANAPLPWVQENLNAMLPEEDASSPTIASNIWLGLQFFGKDFTLPDTAASIVAEQFQDILQQHRPRIEWQEKEAEHAAEYIAEGERHIVYYPSLMSIQQRLNLANDFGIGVSIWELGQGMQYWMDLL